MVRPKEILPVLGFFIVASVSVRTLFNANKRAYFKEFRPAAYAMLERAARQTESPTEGALLVVGDAVDAAADAASDLAGDLVADTASALEAGTALVADAADAASDLAAESSALAAGAATELAASAQTVFGSGKSGDETAAAIAGFRALSAKPAAPKPSVEARAVAARTATSALRGASPPPPPVAAAATQPAAAAAAAQPTAAAAAAAAAAAPAAAQGASGCNRDHSKLLSQDDVLCRVPRGALAFVSLANGAYAELGINWALLLVPVLAKVGHGDRAFLFALDDDGAERFLAKKLPTVKQYTSARHGPRDNDGFRWAPGAFRKYGVTKAEVILWLLKAGRDVCMSDVDAAWIAPPCAARLAARNSCAQFLVRTQVV